MLSIFLSNCKDKPDYQISEDKINVELIKLPDVKKPPLTLTKLEECELKTMCKGWPWFVKTEKNNEIIVFCANSSTTFCLYFYDGSLKFQKQHTIRSGEGPEEIAIPGYFGSVKSTEKMLIIDKSKRQFSIFDRDFKMLKRVNFENKEGFMLMPGNIGLNADFSKILVGFQYSIPQRRKLINSLGWINIDNGRYKNIITREISNNTSKKYLMAVGIRWLIHESYIYYLDQVNYIIIKMDFAGNPVKKIKIRTKSVKFTSGRIRKWMSNSDYKEWSLEKSSFPEQLYHPAAIIKIGNGFAVTRRLDYNPKERQWIEADYFDWDIAYKGKIKLPAYEKWNEPIFDGRKADNLFYYQSPFLYFLDVREDSSYIVKWGIN